MKDVNQSYFLSTTKFKKEILVDYSITYNSAQYQGTYIKASNIYRID